MNTQLVRTILEIRDRLTVPRMRDRIVGLVPTMGALHAGHAALIERARHECQTVVVSIFVNPIQFDRPDDYQAYAIDLAEDMGVCDTLGVDFVFAPSAQEMYPEPPSTFVEVAGVSEHLCGKFRPGHFRGVATVVAKLFHIVRPDSAYFGEKDAQQLAIIQRMVADLNIPVEIVPVPTAREADGLALSSRNRRLSKQERQVAPLLYQALEFGADCIRKGWTSAEQVRTAALSHLQEHPEFGVEYLEVVDPSNMTPVETIHGPVRIATAAWLGSVRLIDNVLADRG
ncbi:MAG: pantoate--beta-alanine ligase [Bryobacteraceae bacterium]